MGAPRARAGSRQVTGLFVVNVQVVEPWLAAFGPVAFAEYVVPFFNRVDGVTVTVVALQGDKVRLGFAAPSSVIIHREEIWQQLQLQDASAACLRK